MHSCRKANPLFTSYEEELEFLDDCGMDIAHATLLESTGRIVEAAEIHLLEGLFALYSYVIVLKAS